MALLQVSLPLAWKMLKVMKDFGELSPQNKGNKK